MSEQANVRMLKDAYASLKQGDIESVLKLLTDDVEWITPGLPELMQTAGNRRGRKEVLEFFATLNKQEEVEFFEPHEYIAQGDKVIALIKYRGRVRGTENQWPPIWCTYLRSPTARYESSMSSMTPPQPLTRIKLPVAAQVPKDPRITQMSAII
jgi:ketosteroid isomerase-like protein